MIVIEDLAKEKIVACGSVFIEDKIIHNLSKCAHIEDIVVDPSYRGLRLGFYVIDKLKKVAMQFNCYKIILDCSEKNVKFYEKCEFERVGVQMAKYISVESSKL